MIYLIFAIDKNNLIGKDNSLPWYYPKDLKYFKTVTTGKKVVMGEKTFFSITDRIGKPLPNRENIVATLDPNFTYENVTVVHDLISYLESEKDSKEEIFVIGGKQIYTLALPYAKRLYITHIDKEYEGNVYFPKIDYQNYNLISETKTDELSFNVYERCE